MNFVALRMLFGDRAKYLGLVFAIAFSTFLLENQTSIFTNVMITTGNTILDVSDAEVWVMDPHTTYFQESRALRDTDLARVRSVPGVQFAVRMCKANPVARTDTGFFSTTVVLGLDDATLTGVPRTMVLGSWERLREPNAIVIDRAGYLLLFPNQPLELERTFELNEHLVRIVGISEALPPWDTFPIIHTRYSLAVEFQVNDRREMSFVLARPQPGITPENLARTIEEYTALRARTTDEFRWDSALYYLLNTGIPINFGMTIGIALIVGTVVAGQTFYLFTVENLRQFGALKAIGVTNWRLVGMILLQALVAGVLGFSLGTGMAAGFFEITSRTVAMRGIYLLWPCVALTAACIFLVVIGASLLSIRRVLILEPASVFR